MSLTASVCNSLDNAAQKTVNTPPLGIIGKSVYPPLITDEAEARLILLRTTRWELLEAAGTLFSDSSTAKCHKWKVPKKKLQEDDLENDVPVQSMVGILRSIKNKSTFYGGVQTCGSIWVCPFCASKVSERKRKELQIILAEWESRAGETHMMTLTIPHGSHDETSDLLSKFSSARTRFFNRKTWRNWKEKVGFRHSVYSLETTHGENGWHIHSHHLLFIMPGPGLKKPCVEDLLEAWQSACTSVGLEKPNQHGLDIRDGTSAGAYVSKWGVDLELTKSHIKKGREGNRTPWDMLRDFAETGDCRSGDLFKQFVLAFKGKKQLVFSRGFRADFCLEPEKTDKQIAEEQEDKAVRLGYLTDTQWFLIVRHRKRGELLEVARYGDWKDVLDFIAQLSFANYQKRRGG